MYVRMEETHYHKKELTHREIPQDCCKKISAVKKVKSCLTLPEIIFSD